MPNCQHNESSSVQNSLIPQTKLPQTGKIITGCYCLTVKTTRSYLSITTCYSTTNACTKPNWLQCSTHDLLPEDEYQNCLTWILEHLKTKISVLRTELQAWLLLNNINAKCIVCNNSLLNWADLQMHSWLNVYKYIVKGTARDYSLMLTGFMLKQCGHSQMKLLKISTANVNAASTCKTTE